MQSLFPLIGTINDNSAKIILLKAYSSLIGFKATILLTHLSNSLEQEFRVAEAEDGKKWHKQNLQWMCYQTTLSKNALRQARQILENEGLLQIKQASSYDRTTYWRLKEGKLSRFYIFAHAVRLIDRPNPLIDKWNLWAKNNKKLVREFKHLAKDLIDGIKRPIDKIEVPVIKRTKPIPSKAFLLKEKIKQQKQSKPISKSISKPAKQIKPCKYVEFWNSLEHTPKCNIGTKAYETARKFFKTHRMYNVGVKDFLLGEDEKIRIGLQKINRHPVNQKYRSSSQMFAHIELAAKVYNPLYGPERKDWLPKSLPAFLYNSYSKKYGQVSLFLERLYKCPPQLLSDTTYDGIMSKMNEQEERALECIKRVYFLANKRSKNDQLSLSELKNALSIVRNIFGQYLRIPVDSIAILANHFGSIWEFMQWWENYAEDHVWDGMPITALDINKNLWRAFVDFASDDIGYNLFTGKRR